MSTKEYLTQWRLDNPEKSGQYSRNWRAKNPIKYWLMTVRNCAKQRGLEFSITEVDLLIDGKLPEFCPVLGVKLDYSKGPRFGRNTRLNVASIDRIDNMKGYIPGNVVVVSLRANYLKKDATLAELQALAEFYTKLADRNAVS